MTVVLFTVTVLPLALARVSFCVAKVISKTVLNQPPGRLSKILPNHKGILSKTQSRLIMQLFMFSLFIKDIENAHTTHISFFNKSLSVSISVSLSPSPPLPLLPPSLSLSPLNCSAFTNPCLRKKHPSIALSNVPGWESYWVYRRDKHFRRAILG